MSERQLRTTELESVFFNPPAQVIVIYSEVWEQLHFKNSVIQLPIVQSIQCTGIGLNPIGMRQEVERKAKSLPPYSHVIFKDSFFLD